MIRVAAVGDMHVGTDSRGRLRPRFAHLSDQADVLLVAGDLTRCGTPEEVEVFVDELSDVGVPVVTVLGNHDYHADAVGEVRAVLRDAGVHVLECEHVVLDLPGGRLGVAGTKGFGGGFAGACGSDFGEPEMKAFIKHTKSIADRLERNLVALSGAACDARVALLHYAPVPDTLSGERLEIYPFLGSYLLAEAVDAVGADLVFHGHAHGGSEKGITAGGVPVRNVAQPVLRRSYGIYCLSGSGDVEACEPAVLAG